MINHKSVENEPGSDTALPANSPPEEAQRADAADLAQEVLDTIRKPLLVLGSGMRVESANSAFRGVFGLTQDEVEGHCLYEVDGGQWDTPGLRTLLEHVWGQEYPPEDLEMQHEFARIGPKTMLLYAQRLTHQGRDNPLILLAVEDITERRRAEEKVQTYVQKLEWSNRELQDFAYIASHDLQEPLRAIQAFGERLHNRVGEDLPEEARDYLDRMLRAAGRMRGLINDLLEFSRITTKARPFTPVNLNEVAKQAWGDLSQRAEETHGRVEAGPLPAVDADATQMRQLLQNLMDNALKYGREGVPPVVTVRGEVVRDDAAARPGRRRAMCRIEVQDNGIGFEEKHAKRIFAPFQRLHGRGKYDGTGIGLAICRKIVERHGGCITARSTPGEGSVFTVLLPVSQSGGE